MIWFLPAIFVLVHSPNGDSVRQYDGQTQATIQSLLAAEGATGDFITQAQYDVFVSSVNRAMTNAELLTALRAEAFNLIDSGTGANPKVMRAILLLMLDEINILRQRDVDRSADVAAATSLADLKTRWAARSAFSQRTAAQLKTAVENKITSGDSD